MKRTALTLATLTALTTMIPGAAQAVRWEPLARTARHNVAIDSSSIRLTPLSRLAVWLRFSPLGDAERRQAAAEYGQKNYRMHLEHYEIDCGEQNAVLMLLDVLGPASSRLSRSKGNNTPDAIIPGSVLDMAMQQICPSMEETAVTESDDTPAPATSEEEPTQPEQKQLSEEVSRAINGAVHKTEADPNSLDAWRELGNLYFDADMPHQAIAAYTRALEIEPNETNILNDQGAMYRQIGDFPKALANFEKARAVDPENLESLYNTGYVLAFDLNQIDKALAIWRQYLAKDTSSDTARQVQSFVERYGKPEGKQGL